MNPPEFRQTGHCRQCGNPSPCLDHEQDQNTQLEYKETKNGLPVLTPEEYDRLYNTHIEAGGEGTVSTFDFQGYVRTPEGDFYFDRMATNGIRSDEVEGTGIHIGTDGIMNYNQMMHNNRMTGPDDVGEYNVYIKVPAAIQRKDGVVVAYDSCETIEDYKSRWFDEDDDPEEVQDRLKHVQQQDGYIVIRLGIDPTSDKNARKKVFELHQAMVAYVQNGGPLDELKERVFRADEILQQGDQQQLPDLNLT